MNIVFFHGKLSTPSTSSTAKSIKSHFSNVLIPDYKPNENSYSDIEKYLKEYIKENCDLSEETIFIGISLGGFWAANMSHIFKYSKCILLNPSLNYYGVNHTLDFKHSQEVTIILNMDDELLDSKKTKEKYEKRADVITFKSGGHRMTNINEVIPVIKKAIYNEII